MSQQVAYRCRSAVGFLGAVVLSTLTLVGCGGGTSPAPQAGPGAPEPVKPAGALELLFAYGSEKESWLKEVTDTFNRGGHRTAGGKPIFVTLRPMGSGECIDEPLAGRLQAHLVSPASAAFIDLGNAESRAKTGKPLLERTENLVLSPVVIATWKPMAEALGWPNQPVGWSDVLALAKDPQGWAAHGHPEWGSFKFGHTHPDYSNSGLISLFAEVYAGAGKVKGLTADDVKDPKVAHFLEAIERSVVHYGSSTGFFGNKMFANGPQYLSAAVLYENMVIESYDARYQGKAFDVVALYPKEGTFWSDHPVGVVERPWVTDEHREAAKAYVKYLLDRPQQEKALAHGFRPGDVAVPLASPIDTAHGVSPQEPKTTLEVPPVEVMTAVKDLWQKHKKHCHVTLVFDISGSMSQQNRMANARPGAAQFVSLLTDDDMVSFLPFNNQLFWAEQGVLLKDGRKRLTARINGLVPGGGTALYDAIDAAYQYEQKNPHPGRIAAVVVLTDGDDTNSKLTLDGLLQRIRFDAEKQPIRIFTIGYGSEARKDILKKIADATQAKSYEGKPENIHEVFRDIATFF
jgi:Ca-activated chloride channel family protein